MRTYSKGNFSLVDYDLYKAEMRGSPTLTLTKKHLSKVRHLLSQYLNHENMENNAEITFEHESECVPGYLGESNISKVHRRTVPCHRINPYQPSQLDVICDRL